MTGAENPFQFFQICRLTELTGRQASTAGSLREGISRVPPACIFYHTHHAFLRVHRVGSDFTNDFAQWVTEALQQYRLGEKLAGVDLLGTTDLEELRSAFLEVLDGEARDHGEDPREARPGEAFHFVRAHTVVYPLGAPVRTLADLRSAIEHVPGDSLFYHFFEARLRPGRQTNDFSYWLATQLEQPELARRIEHIDPYVLSLEELRGRMLGVLSISGKAA